MKNRVLILILLFLSFASAQTFDIQIANVGSEYYQGDTAMAAISVKLLDSALAFENAVIFLNVVEIDEARKYPQVAHKIFAAADNDVVIFKTVFTKDELLTGVATNLTFKLKNNAKTRKYAMVIQIFEGKNTNPHRLAGKHRIAFKAHNFSILDN